MAYIDRPLDTSPSTTMTIRQGGDLINDNFDELSGTYSTIQQRRIDLFEELQEYGYTSEVDYAGGVVLNTLSELVYSGGEFWKVSDSALLPYTTDGTGVPEGGAFVSVGDSVLRDDLGDPAQGGDLVQVSTATGGQTLKQALNQRIIYVESITDLLFLPIGNISDGQKVYLNEYHQGGKLGGGVFYWDENKVKSSHDGGTVIDPAAPFPATWTNQTELNAWFDNSGASGTGCWVRQYDGAVLPEWFGAETGADGEVTSIIFNRAIDATDSGLHIPSGEYNISVDAGYGVKVKHNLVITGNGMRKTILNAVGGGTISQLRNYQAGSVISREFDATIAQDRVEQVRISHLAVVLNHPFNSISTDKIQIGIDYRNITRGTVQYCWVGNYHPITNTKGGTRPFLVQGYGIVAGNESGQVSYAGGEVNTFYRNFVVGCYQNISIDDNLLTPISAAYSTRVLENDVQIGQLLISQDSQYGAANVIKDNILQSLQTPDGSTAKCIGVYINGYGNTIEEPYGEYGNDVDHILSFGSSSNNNVARYSGVCSASAIRDDAFHDATTGDSKNTVEYFDDDGSLPGGWISGGNRIHLYNRSWKTATLRFHWDGAAMVYDGRTSNEITVSRLSAGDYLINLGKTQVSADYTVSVALTTNASREPGLFSISSKSAPSFRLETYAMGASVSKIDPLFVEVTINQG